MTNLYEQDFVLWAEHQANLIRVGKFEHLDVENLIEEIEYMARKDKRSIASYLIVLMTHVIKWKIQPSHRSKSWRNSINETRRQIIRIRKDSPSLNENFMETVWEDCLKNATEKAEDETDLKSTVQSLSWQEVFEEEYVLHQN